MRVLAIILAAGLMVSACNTIEGAGRDIQGAGEVVEDGARTVKKAISN